MLSHRPSYLKIDLSALRSNFYRLKAQAGTSRILCAVKANAYGHGLEECARVLESAGADYFGVALAEEGIRLRKSGCKLPILVFGGLLGEEVDLFLEHDLEITASSIFKLREIAARARALGKNARVHLKFDTGMGRIGVQFDRSEAFLEEAARTKDIEVVGVFSHFASADAPDLGFARIQLERFLYVCELSKQILGFVPLRHIANSGALLQLHEANLDMVRPGIALFGVAPTPVLQSMVPLKPVMSVHSRIVYFKVLSAGSGVSYGPSWHTKKQTRIVTIPVGYADGLFRNLSNHASVLIRGKRYPIVGTICMDQCMVDVGDDEAYVGDEVVIVGTQGQSTISVHEVARAAHTIAYECLTALNNRLPRVHQ